MRLSNLVNPGNERALAGFAVAAFLIAAVVAAKLAITLFNFVSNWRFEHAAKTKARALRLDGGGRPTLVRQTDVISRMNALDRRLHGEAEDLIAIGKVREGAKILEQIKFQRGAIDALEKAGYIDDACAVLVRMNLPHRAAVIYERNKQYEKAAHFFGAANQFDNTGRMLTKAAEVDPRFLEPAAAAFERAQKSVEYRATLSAMLATDRLIEACRKENRLDALFDYAREPRLHAAIGEKIPANERKTLLDVTPLFAKNVTTLASWSVSPALAAWLPAILNRVAAVPFATDYFWRALNASERREVFARSQSLVAEMDPAAVEVHQRARAAAELTPENPDLRNLAA